VNNSHKPERAFLYLARVLRSVFGGSSPDSVPESTAASDLATTAAAKSRDAAVARSSAEATSAASASDLLTQGLQQRQLNGVEAARPYFEQAAQIEPHSHLPWLMLGNVASELGELDVAVRHYTRARDLCPGDHVIRYNLGLNQIRRGYTDAAIEELRVACGLKPSYIQAQSSLIMALHHSDRISPDEIAATTREWGLRFSIEHPASAPLTVCLDTGQPKRLRVGFISGDFRAHSVAHFFEPILNARDRGAFAYVLYSNFHAEDAVTQRLRADADDWRDVWGVTDDALIDLVRSDRIDILFDLSGHYAFNRLAVFARRAAPVQVSYLGYPSSTGLATIDYRIADGVTDPPGPADKWHCERLLRLPGSQWCFRAFGASTVQGSLPARETGFVTFGSFNTLTKTSDAMLRCWVEILVKLPSARLRLTRVLSAERAAEIVALFGQSGVASERIDCVPYANDPPYGQQFAGVDIALDTYPYNGVTTTCESLYVGVPVISLHGRNGVSRSGLSLLGALGLYELVASTPEQYVDIAVALGSDLPRLEQLRASLGERFERSSLRDEKRFAENFEKLLRDAWQEHLDRCESEWVNLSPPSAADH
jgi:protein O-GlcNAc transferase